MPNPRKYGSSGLFPGLRPKKPKPDPAKWREQWRIERYIREAAADLNGTSSCIPCRRTLDRHLTAAREKPLGSRILPAECCDSCGRWPIDQALIDKGHLGVQSDPRWAVDRVRIAAMRTTFAPGEKVYPSQREVESA